MTNSDLPCDGDARFTMEPSAVPPIETCDVCGSSCSLTYQLFKWVAHEIATDDDLTFEQNPELRDWIDHGFFWVVMDVIRGHWPCLVSLCR